MWCPSSVIGHNPKATYLQEVYTSIRQESMFGLISKLCLTVLSSIEEAGRQMKLEKEREGEGRGRERQREI